MNITITKSHGLELKNLPNQTIMSHSTFIFLADNELMFQESKGEEILKKFQSQLAKINQEVEKMRIIAN